MAERSSQKGYLFNCDQVYDLDVVEKLFLEMDEKHGLNISTEKLYFGLSKMTEMCESTIPQLQMDFATFVVQANESRLSINEEGAGIGYAKIYRALLEATGDRVLIVIGGDDHYQGEDEEERTVISRWARRKVSSQFKDEYLDGRESFIFSWNKKHREIHEEALLHYFDPSKKGQKFEYQQKPKPVPVPVPKTEEPKVIISPPTAKDIQKEKVEKDSKEKLLPKDERDREQQKQKASYGAINLVADYPADTILLETRMRYGEISYQKHHVKRWEDSWLPSDEHITHLMKHHKTTRDAKVQFISQGNGEVQIIVVDVTSFWRRCWDEFCLLLEFIYRWRYCLLCIYLCSCCCCCNCCENCCCCKTKEEEP